MTAHDARHESASRVSVPHLVRHLIHENVMYPPHPPRTETPEYKEAHKRLVYDEDRPCFICNVRNSTLGDAQQNLCGATEMETHHLYVEWALIDATSVEKLNDYFGKDFDEAAWKRALDSDELNLLVLCDVHHRHKEAGIHELTYPIWIAQKFLKPDYHLFSDTPAHPPTN